jgi:hypothetical protein
MGPSLRRDAWRIISLLFDEPLPPPKCLMHYLRPPHGDAWRITSLDRFLFTPPRYLVRQFL